MRVVGLDLSLTSTGVCVAGHGALAVDVITSTAAAGTSLGDRAARLAVLRREVAEWTFGADVVVVEAPSLGQSRQAGAFDRAGLWWQVVARLIREGTPVAEVAPASLKLYATGSGTAGKVAVVDAVARRYGHLVERLRTDDEADAVVLAAMGARHLGHPLEASLPKANLAALNKVRWPEAVDAR